MESTEPSTGCDIKGKISQTLTGIDLDAQLMSINKGSWEIRKNAKETQAQKAEKGKRRRENFLKMSGVCFFPLLTHTHTHAPTLNTQNSFLPSARHNLCHLSTPSFSSLPPLSFSPSSPHPSPPPLPPPQPSPPVPLVPLWV